MTKEERETELSLKKKKLRNCKKKMLVVNFFIWYKDKKALGCGTERRSQPASCIGTEYRDQKKETTNVNIVNSFNILFSNVDTFSSDKFNELKLRLQLMDTKPFIIDIQEVKLKNFRSCFRNKYRWQ